MNNEVTSNDISLKLFGILCPFIWVMKLLVLLTVYSDVLRGDKSLAKYFASWYDAVLMLEIIGRVGRSSTVWCPLERADKYIVIEEIISHLSRFLKNDYASGDTFYYKVVCPK